MAKNRRSNKKARNRRKRLNGYYSPICIAGIMIAIVSAGVFKVWIETRCSSIGKEIKRLEQDAIVLKEKFLNEEMKWMRMKSARNLERVLVRHGIDMDWPSDGQVILLADASMPANDGFDLSLEPEERYARVAGMRRND